MRLQRIDALRAPPAPGRYYSVPCAFVKAFDRLDWWPVRGHWHEDKKLLEFPLHHYHLDGRFLNKDQRRYVGGQYDAPESEFATAFTYGFGGLVRRINGAAIGALRSSPNVEPPVEWKRRKCWTSSVPVIFGCGPSNLQLVRKFCTLKNEFAGAQCPSRDGQWICPHKGYGLGAEPVENGRITCPLHGLIIDAQTGVVLPHACAS